MSVIALPKSHNSGEEWRQLVQRQKDFRLTSLKLSPESFGSTYEAENQFEDSKWESRLTSPLATTIIALDSPEAPDTDQERIALALSSTWIGSVVLVGPLSKDQVTGFYKDSDVSMDVVKHSSGTEASAVPTYIVNAVYVIPSHRRRGLGIGLLDFALRTAKESSRQGGGCLLRLALLISPKSQDAMNLYFKSGFRCISDPTESHKRSNVLMIQDFVS
jgi:GNAT superfamily N-acetyltransferase